MYIDAAVALFALLLFPMLVFALGTLSWLIACLSQAGPIARRRGSIAPN